MDRGFIESGGSSLDIGAWILGVCATFRRYIDRYEEETVSSFQGIREVIVHRGLFSTLYTDCGSHYWYTPE